MPSYIVIFRSSRDGKKQAVKYRNFYIVFDEIFKANFWARRNGGTIKKHRGEGPFVMIDKVLESAWLAGTEWPDAEAFWKDAKAGFPMQREQEKAIVAKIQEARRAKESSAG